MYAIIVTGGKQYKVAEGDVIDVEKLDAQPGDKVRLDVLMLVDGDKVVTTPEDLADIQAEAEVVDQHKSAKVLVFKLKKRKRYHRTKGHRQNLTRVKILSIGADDATAEVGVAEPKHARKVEELEDKPVEASGVEVAEDAAEEKPADPAVAAEETPKGETAELELKHEAGDPEEDAQTDSETVEADVDETVTQEKDSADGESDGE